MIIVGWLGVVFGLLVAPPQLIKILRTGKTADISIWTYTFLVCCMTCYLIYAISIKDAVFITAQAVNLTVNGIILWHLVKRK